MPQLHTTLLANETFYDMKLTAGIRRVVFSTCLRRYNVVIPPFLFASIFSGTDIAIRIIGTHQVFAAYINIIIKTTRILYDGLQANLDYAEKVAQRKLRKLSLMTTEQQMEIKKQLDEKTYVEELTPEEIEQDETEKKKEEARLAEMRELIGNMLTNFEEEFVLMQMVNQRPLDLMQFLEDRVIQILAAFRYINKEPGTYEEHLNKLSSLKTTQLVYMNKGRCVEDHYEQVLHETERANELRRDALNKMLQVENLPEKHKKLLYKYLSS